MALVAAMEAIEALGVVAAGTPVRLSVAKTQAWCWCASSPTTTRSS